MYSILQNVIFTLKLCSLLYVCIMYCIFLNTKYWHNIIGKIIIPN